LKIAEKKPGARSGPPPGGAKAAARLAALEALIASAGPEHGDLSSGWREVMATLVAEVARLRAELERVRARAEHLERLADEDALMPVANRRAFMRELSRLLALARRYGTESSVVYLDLNDLKLINDQHGHNAGDAALMHVAHVLVENVRHADVVARLGGDEFGVLLVKADQTVAGEKAAALAQAVAERPLPWGGTMLTLSVAFGAHSFHGSETLDEVLEAADRAMYVVKQSMKAAGGV
jgi:diguanylate cyclase (GGDEF)-like protein